MLIGPLQFAGSSRHLLVCFSPSISPRPSHSHWAVHHSPPPLPTPIGPSTTLAPLSPLFVKFFWIELNWIAPPLNSTFRLHYWGELPTQRLPGCHHGVHPWILCLRSGVEHHHPHPPAPQDRAQHGCVARSAVPAVVSTLLVLFSILFWFEANKRAMIRNVLSFPEIW